MKWILILLLLIGSVGYGQSTYYIQADTVKMRKIGGNSELIIENATRSVKGILTNYSGGRTKFIKPRVSADTLFIGMDTLFFPAGGGQTLDQTLALGDSSARNLIINDTIRNMFGLVHSTLKVGDSARNSKTILFIGHSVVASVGVPTYFEGFPMKTANILGRVPILRGISGTTLQHHTVGDSCAFDRLYWYPTWNPAIHDGVWMMWDINDANASFPLDTATYRAEVHRYIDSLHIGRGVPLNKINWLSANYVDTSVTNNYDNIRLYVNTGLSAAQQKGVNTFDLFYTMEEAGGSYYLTDEDHPNEIGTSWIANYIAKNTAENKVGQALINGGLAVDDSLFVANYVRITRDTVGTSVNGGGFNLINGGTSYFRQRASFGVTSQFGTSLISIGHTTGINGIELRDNGTTHRTFISGSTITSSDGVSQSNNFVPAGVLMGGIGFKFTGSGAIDHVYHGIFGGSNFGSGAAGVAPDSALNVLQGSHFKRGIRASNLPTGKTAKQIYWNPSTESLQVGDSTGTGGGATGWDDMLAVGQVQTATGGINLSNNILIIDSADNFQIIGRGDNYGDESARLYIGNGPTEAGLVAASSGLFGYPRANVVATPGASNMSANTTSGIFSNFQVFGDSIKILPHLGQINIDSLREVSDTVNYKPTAWNKATGEFVKHNYWPAGSGGSYGDADVEDFLETYTGDVTFSGTGSVIGSGKVTNTMLAGSIAISKLSITGTPDGTKFLKDDGTWAVPAGGGDVSKVGTPANQEVGVWTGDGTLGRSADFKWDGSTIFGKESATGTVPSFSVVTDVNTGFGGLGSEHAHVISNGTAKQLWNTTETRLASNYPLTWSSGGGSGVYAAGAGTGIQPASDGLLEINNGTAGTRRDLILRKLNVVTGSNASTGTSGAMTAGTITVSTTQVTSSSIIMLVHASVGGTQGILSVGTITNGTSFVINSSSATDTGTVNWWIIN